MLTVLRSLGLCCEPIRSCLRRSSMVAGVEEQKVLHGQVLKLSAKAVEMDQRYWLVALA